MNTHCTLSQRAYALFVAAILPFTLLAKPVSFDLPAQAAADAILGFSRQAGTEVLFSYPDLQQVESTAVSGDLEPATALTRLLGDTGFSARMNADGKFVVQPRQPAAARGIIEGRLLLPDQTPASGIRVTLRGAGRSVLTDAEGIFVFPDVTTGSHRLTVEDPGHHPLHITRIEVEAGRRTTLEPQRLARAENVTQMEPFIVEASVKARSPFGDNPPPPRHATGNLDLPRTENDALPYQIYARAEITRSGVIDLNEFLQRVVLENSPADQSAPGGGFIGGGLNLSLRGYTRDETVVLVNGRRLPEVLTSEDGALPPDVDFIPLSLVQQVEILPVSASSLYSGNPVGGVINIVLRSDLDATEVTSTYTNRLGGFDASHTTVALQHGQSLLGGALRLRLSAATSQSLPANEGELSHRQSFARRQSTLTDPLFRATPNVRSADSTPLFGPGTATFTSVAPGSDGTTGLAAFSGRDGERSLDFFNPPGGLAASIFSVDAPYGRKQRRSTLFASAVYDLASWLQIGLDAAHARTVVNRGHEVLTAELTVGATSPFNPFGQDVIIALNEVVPLVGESYSESRTDFTSLVGGLIVTLPGEWRLALDAQYARNVARYRGLAAPDRVRWQQLVDEGRYQPLRDTQLHGPGDAFYNEVLVYQGAAGEFGRLGDYRTLELAARVTQGALRLPTGDGVLNLGADYRRTEIMPYTDERRRADGSLAEEPIVWSGRLLERYSFFGELQAPLLPARLRPCWLNELQTSLAVRYIASSQTAEANFAPTAGFKLGLANGIALRGSFTTSNRFPPPRMSQRVEGSTGPGSGLNFVRITDPLRGESYDVLEELELNPSLQSEAAVTQTAGLIFQRGRSRRLRASIDFVDTQKTDELVSLEPAAVVNLESLFPDRVNRAAPADSRPGRIVSLVTGAVNAASRRSQNWNLSLDYAQDGLWGGTVELRSRMVYFQRYDLQLYGNSPTVDQLDEPDGAAPALLRYRAHSGAGWSGPRVGFGIDGQYFHSRILPISEHAAQNSDRIRPYWQFDTYLQADLGKWLPWIGQRHGLRAQVRINNVFGFDPPRYANEPTGAGVRSYGDWRGRVYSLSLTTTF